MHYKEAYLLYTLSQYPSLPISSLVDLFNQQHPIHFQLRSLYYIHSSLLKAGKLPLSNLTEEDLHWIDFYHGSPGTSFLIAFSFNQTFTQYAYSRHHWLPGANAIYARPGTLFLDYPFKTNYSWEKYLEITQKISPVLTVAPDIFSYQDLDKTIQFASLLQQHSQHVILVPKIPHILHHIPTHFLIGYSIPTSYGSADPSILLEIGERPVHLLGGSLENIIVLLHTTLNIFSLDINSFCKSVSTYHKIINQEGRSEKSPLKLQQRMEVSIDNIHSIFTQIKTGNFRGFRKYQPVIQKISTRVGICQESQP